MKIGEICNRQVVIIRPEESLLEAGKRMREYHVGCLVAVQEEQGRRSPVGILTDRDLLIQVLSEGVSLEKIAVGDLMASKLVTANIEDEVYETIKIMQEKGIRRLPVVDSEKNLIGILAMDDLLEFLTEEIQGLSKIYSREQRKEAREHP